MEKNAQVEALKKALDLEKLIIEKQGNLSDLFDESFGFYSEPPEKPERVIIPEPIYPRAKSQFKISTYLKSVRKGKWVFLIIPFINFIVIFTIVRDGIQEMKKASQDAKVSEEYKSLCAALDKEREEKQAYEDKKYEEAFARYEELRHEYETVTLPQQNKEIEAWNEKHNREIETVQKVLDEATNDLINHYEITKIIPVQYRRVDIIQFLYDMISTSDYDIIQAIDKYDQKVQRELEMERLREQQISNEQQRIANEEAATQNALLQEQNTIANKARRDANIAAIVGTAQRHNTNKYLKK